MDKVIAQSRLGVRTRFTFEDELVRFTVRDWAGGNDINVPYETIDLAGTSLIIVKEQRLFRLGLLSMWVMFMLAYFVGTGAGETGFQIGFGLCIAIALLLVVWQVTNLFDVEQTLVPNAAYPGMPMRVIGGRYHDEIMDLLAACKRTRVRALLATLDLNGDLAHEQAKFDWLLANGFVDAAEHANALAKLAAAGIGQPASSSIN